MVTNISKNNDIFIFNDQAIKVVAVLIGGLPDLSRGRNCCFSFKVCLKSFRAKEQKK
jgi:hypothetical protein